MTEEPNREALPEEVRRKVAAFAKGELRCRHNFFGLYERSAYGCYCCYLPVAGAINCCIRL